MLRFRWRVCACVWVRSGGCGAVCLIRLRWRVCAGGGAVRGAFPLLTRRGVQLFELGVFALYKVCFTLLIFGVIIYQLYI